MPYRIGRHAYLDNLDEDLSTVDGSEAEIYSKFNDIASDKTAISISHRLSSCKYCDSAGYP